MMKLALAVAVISLTVEVWSACGAGDPSLCQQLAARAEALKAQTWVEGSKVLRPLLEIDQINTTDSQGFEADLAQNPAIRTATGADDGDWGVFVDHMVGTDLYAASTYRGTLHCQTSAFVRARPGGGLALIDKPAGDVWGGDEGGLCWTRSGDFGRAFGHPAFIEHGANNQATDDEDIRITPWEKDHWSTACVLKLRFRPVFTVTQRHCGDAAVCTAVDHEVLDIVAAYHQFRQNPRNDQPFRYAGSVTDKTPVDIERAVKARESDTGSPDLPKFGESTDSDSFSYSGLAYFPLSLNGRAYVAAIGHQGVGWRENTTAFLAIYTLKDGALVPQAGYAIDRSIGELKAANAE